LSDQCRNNMQVVINACELRTGSAFRFGSRESACSRYGVIDKNDVDVAAAVSMSAAYPVFLPAVDQNYTLTDRNGNRSNQRVVITDGGIYDNLGVSCMWPNRSAEFSHHVYSPKRIICCSAGARLFSNHTIPYLWPSRMIRSFESVFRKAIDSTYQRLHDINERGQIEGFILAYMGQIDSRLPMIIPDLVPRDAVFGCPTDFFAMNDVDMQRLMLRGEQLMRGLVFIENNGGGGGNRTFCQVN